MKTCTLVVACAASLCVGQAGAAIIIDNYSTEQNGATSGAVANFAVQSFTVGAPGLGTLDTTVANSPLPSTVTLESATFLRAVSGDATAGSLFIDVYLGDGDDGTYIGSSTNSIDVNSATGLDELAWTFNSLSLTTGSQYGLVFSTDAAAGASVIARVQVARDITGNFLDSYAAGIADNDGDNSSPSGFDARFRVEVAPEPGSLALMGLGGLALLRRRRA